MNPKALLLGAAVALGGCSTHYHTLKVDERTDLYPTTTKVDPGGVLAYDTSVDPRQFPFVLMVTRANLRPSGLAFTVRHALAQSGFSKVYSPSEFLLLAKDRGFSFTDDRINAESLRRFSAEVGPVLIVDMTYQFVGDARMYSNLVVVDARKMTPLLRVDHPRTVWSDFDGEALLPMLNQLRKWVKDSSKGAA